jgi:hypothetical protein
MAEKIEETESVGSMNGMGTSSSTAGSGPIDTYDPLLKQPTKEKSKLRKLFPLKRKMPTG